MASLVFVANELFYAGVDPMKFDLSGPAVSMWV
jgi:hypothetical protein